jgi:hypothetical protein
MKRLLGLCLTAILIAGCATGPSRFALEMDPLVGKADKGYFVDKYGPPDKQAIVRDGVEVWEYRLGEQKFTSSTGYRFSTFDRMRLTFARGVLSAWSHTGVTE